MRTIFTMLPTHWVQLALIALCQLFPISSQANTFTTKRWLTTQGAQVVFYQAMEVPMLDITIAFAAGSAQDGAEEGISSLTSRLLNQGNAGLNANLIAEKLSDTGAQYRWENNRDMATFSLKTLTTEPNLKAATDVFSLILSQPDFPKAAFEREKNQQLMAIAQTKESPADVANDIFFQQLYANHPYAHPVNGDNDHVKAITLQQVQSFYQRFFVANNATIVLVGAINEQTAHQLAEKLTKQLSPGNQAPEIPTAHPLQQAMTQKIPFPSSQSMLRLGQLGIDHHNPHYFPLIVGNYILGGGGLVSQLALELRGKRGLTYGVYSQFSPMSARGPFLINLSTKNSQSHEALHLSRETLANFIKQGPTSEELLGAKNYLVGSFPLSLASNSNIADMLLKIAFYHLPNDFLDTYTNHIQAVTTPQIQQAFKETIDPTKLLEVTVGSN